MHEEYSGKNVLITGGLGFIGSNLAIRLIDLGATVTIVDSMIPDYGGNLFNVDAIKDRVRINFSDVRDQYAMQYLLKGQQYVFNLAGQVSHIDSMEDPFADLEINARSQLSILESCRRHNPEVKIVFTSTRQVYGKPDYLPVDEKHLLHPTDVNGINKMAGEWYHIVYNNVYGVRATALRLTNTYGPRQLMKHSRQGFIAWFIRKAVSGEEITIFGDGSQRRDLNYVDDVVEALLIAGLTEKANGQVFNLGGTENISLLNLAKLLIEINGGGSYALVPFPRERKQIDIGDFYGDFEKIKSNLGWEPRISLRDGLSKTLDYYRRYAKHYWESHL
jgi:UDP-glucose 4-epimerase